jgi:hypothetical protein
VAGQLKKMIDWDLFHLTTPLAFCFFPAIRGAGVFVVYLPTKNVIIGIKF